MTLSLDGVSVRFDGAEALRDVSLAVAPGECLGLLGPNGAGKTTLLDAISGRVRPVAGVVRLGDRRLTGLGVDAVARAGVGRAFQSPRLFTRMTVEENVRAGRPLDAAPWLAFAGLEARRAELAGALTPGEGRRLELARALAGEPRVLLLDEPFGGLTAAEAEVMASLVLRAVTPERIVLLVEHRVGLVTRLCPRTVVLHLGEKIFDGPSASLASDPRVVQAYLGSR
jgi:branched-chain amino acid transport system ATP-binding protein